MEYMEFRINDEIDLIAYRKVLFVNNKFGQSEASEKEVERMRDALNKILKWWNNE